MGRPNPVDRRLEPFRVASRLDPDDLTGMTASELHLATMGGVWQADSSDFGRNRARSRSGSPARVALVGDAGFTRVMGARTSLMAIRARSCCERSILRYRLTC